MGRLTFEAIQRLPKTDLHVHLDGSLRLATILDLARKVRELTGSKSEIVHKSYDQAYEVGFEDMTRRVPGIEKVGDAIGWKPQYDLNKILADVIAFHQARS